MAALRCLSGPSSYPSPRRTPSLLFCFRGISSKLFVKGISFRTTEESLSRAFSQFGKVLEARVIKNKVTNRSKGFAYVTFREENEAQQALEEMNGKLLDGRVIYVDYELGRQPKTCS